MKCYCDYAVAFLFVRNIVQNVVYTLIIYGGDIMWLDLDIYGIRLYMKINNYTESSKKNWYDNWCYVNLTVDSSFIHYEINSDILLACEIKSLCEDLKALLDYRLKEEKHIECAEPDFEFKLYPDGYMDWIIHMLNNGAVTDDYINMRLKTDDIRKLYNYLLYVMGNS